MYFSKIVLLCLGIIAVVRADEEGKDEDDDGIGMTSDELADALEPFGEHCDIKPEREHIKQLLKNDENPHQTSKCFRHCLLADFGVIPKGDTKMDVEKAVEMLGAMYPDAKESLKKIVEKCNEKNKDITEQCENAHQHGMCVIHELKECGFKVPNIG